MARHTHANMRKNEGSSSREQPSAWLRKVDARATTRVRSGAEHTAEAAWVGRSPTMDRTRSSRAYEPRGEGEGSPPPAHRAWHREPCEHQLHPDLIARPHLSPCALQRMQPPRALAQMQQRPCVAALRWHSQPSAPPRSCAPRACRRYPQRSPGIPRICTQFVSKV